MAKSCHSQNHVERLHQLVQRATGESSASDYISYATEEDDFGIEYVCTVKVRVTALGCDTSHSGKPDQNKKAAKANAARAALNDATLKSLLQPLALKAKESNVAKTIGAEDDGLENGAKKVWLKESVETCSKEVQKVQRESAERLADEVDQRSSKKSQLQLEKERKAAKRKAAKAAKAATLAAAAKMSLEEESSEEESDSDQEQDSEEQLETSTDVGSEDEADSKFAELAAKIAAIRIAFAARKESKRGSSGYPSRSKMATCSRKVDKNVMRSVYAETHDSSSKGEAKNYSQAVSWKTQVGPKTHIAKP